MLTNEQCLDTFAIQCFRDTGDEDYICARLAIRAALVTPSLWESQQAIEKYLKCILLLNRIKPDVFHDMGKALCRIENSGKLSLGLTTLTRKFIEYLDDCARFRYQEISTIAFGQSLIALDRAVWELRRYCSSSIDPQQTKLRHGELPPIVRIPGGHLEKIMQDKEHLARVPLMRNNGFFGTRRRRHVRVHKSMTATNAPLFNNPQISEEVRKYVYLPGKVVAGYRNQ
jgi:HEPN domain-containing protein